MFSENVDQPDKKKMSKEEKLDYLHKYIEGWKKYKESFKKRGVSESDEPDLFDHMIKKAEMRIERLTLPKDQWTKTPLERETELVLKAREELQFLLKEVDLAKLGLLEHAEKADGYLGELENIAKEKKAKEKKGKEESKKFREQNRARREAIINEKTYEHRRWLSAHRSENGDIVNLEKDQKSDQDMIRKLDDDDKDLKSGQAKNETLGRNEDHKSDQEQKLDQDSEMDRTKDQKSEQDKEQEKDTKLDQDKDQTLGQDQDQELDKVRDPKMDRTKDRKSEQDKDDKLDQAGDQSKDQKLADGSKIVQEKIQESDEAKDQNLDSSDEFEMVQKEQDEIIQEDQNQTDPQSSHCKLM